MVILRNKEINRGKQKRGTNEIETKYRKEKN